MAAQQPAQRQLNLRAAAAADPLAFVLPPHSGGSSSSSSAGLGEVCVSLFKVVDITRDSITASFFYNSQRSLLEPLQYQGDMQQVLALSSVSGRVVHVLEPDGPGEVLAAVDAAVVESVQGVLCDVAANL